MKAIASLLLMFFCQSAIAQVAYVCMAEKVTGFSYQGDSWKTVEGGISYRKYSLKMDTEGWKFKIFDGSPMESLECSHSSVESMICSSKSGIYIAQINTQTLRYVLARGGSYTFGVDDRYGGPDIEIGRCNRI